MRGHERDAVADRVGYARPVTLSKIRRASLGAASPVQTTY
jgi:hypothetical protein